MSNLRRVHFHGYLKEICPEPVTVAAATAAEAVDLATRQIKGFRPRVGRGRHRVRVAGFDTVESLSNPTDAEDLHVVPDMTFGKSGGFFKIVLGAVLIAASFLMPPAGIALGSLTLSTSSVFWFGVAMALGGLLELISPAPKMDMKVQSDPEPSKYLGTPKNTTKAGTRIPLLYGEHIAYGHYLSFDIDAKDVAV